MEHMEFGTEIGFEVLENVEVGAKRREMLHNFLSFQQFFFGVCRFTRLYIFCCI